jgi:hypothetical protein
VTLVQRSIQSPLDRELRPAPTKRPVSLIAGQLRLKADRSGRVESVYSAGEKKLIFGGQFIRLVKVQAGIRVQPPPPEWSMRFSPFEAKFSTKVFGTLAVEQTVRVFGPPAQGFVRTVRVSNGGSEPLRIALLCFNDPTATYSRVDRDPPGALGVNAFNRTSHVAMDDTGDSTGARAIGSSPPPQAIFMTRDRARALEVLEEGALPDNTAGMTGQILVVTHHEFEVAPRQSVEVTYISAYDSSKLENALSGFTTLSEKHESSPGPEHPALSSASDSLDFAFEWGAATCRSEWESSLLDSLESLPGAFAVDPKLGQAMLARAKASQRRDGSLPHSSSENFPGILETALYLSYCSVALAALADKKAIRAMYPSLRNAAKFLSSTLEGNLVRSKSEVPQGWRRGLPAGFPAGATTELNLSVARAFREFSSLAMAQSKGNDAASFAEKGALLESGVFGKMTEVDTKRLLLNIDAHGRPHPEETLDQVVGCYRFPYNRNVSGSLVRRTLEDDFATPYGPRTVPSTNKSYFNGVAYNGQVGGYWPRAALAQALLSYYSGFAGLGSSSLLKVARLVHLHCPSLGGLQGEFPHWVDVEGKIVHGDGSDRVAASRFIEALVQGELGLSSDGSKVDPPRTSEIPWLFLEEVWAGSRGTFFLGRDTNCAKVVTTKPQVEGAVFCGKYERLTTDSDDVTAVQFHAPGSILCAGNRSSRQVNVNLAFQPRDVSLLTHLSAKVEELDHSTGKWTEAQRVRVVPKMSIPAELKPKGWRIFRLTAI